MGTASSIIRPRGPLGWLDPGHSERLALARASHLAQRLPAWSGDLGLFRRWPLGYSIAEFDTFVRHGVPVIAVVGNDGGWTQVAREQVKMLKDDAGTKLNRSAYHEVAAGFGAEGILLTSDAEVPDTLLRAKAAAKAGKPVLINAWLSPTGFREASHSM